MNDFKIEPEKYYAINLDLSWMDLGVWIVRSLDDATRVDLKAQANGIGATVIRACRKDGTSLCKQSSLPALTHFHELIRHERRRTDDGKVFGLRNLIRCILLNVSQILRFNICDDEECRRVVSGMIREFPYLSLVKQIVEAYDEASVNFVLIPRNLLSVGIAS